MGSKNKASTPKAADRNPDPITNEPGAHPVGVGLGAATGGAAAGAAAGAVAGPVGAVVGAVVGGIAGGYAGKAAAEAVDPSIEDAYWRDNYRTRPYYDSATTYDEYAPAYRYGWEGRQRYPDRCFDEVEADLQSGWGRARDNSKLDWQRAREATRDAWDRSERPVSGDVNHGSK